MATRLEAISRSLAGHYWTVRPFVSQYSAARYLLPGWASRARPPNVEQARPWLATVEDERWGRLQLTGWLNAPPRASGVLLVMHGLGGSAESLYLSAAVTAAAAAGWACLRLSMRGADGSGEDFYHAALTADLHAALASPWLASYSDIFVIGYSLGGHLTLRLASEAHDPRLRAVAAVCSPIDLARSAWAIDRPVSTPYRRYVLQRLKQCYLQVAQRRPVPTPLDRVLGLSSLRRWDACTVVPRYGFASTGDYYERASAAGRLSELRVPALLVNTEHDPMVPAETVRPALLGGTPRLDVRWLRSGGHVGFPPGVDLGERAPLGLESQLVHWLGNTPSGVHSRGAVQRPV